MEPFSLFHFLQNFLSSAAAEPPATTETAPPAELNMDGAKEHSVPPTTPPSSQEAVLQFLSAHERRVHRTKFTPKK